MTERAAKERSCERTRILGDTESEPSFLAAKCIYLVLFLSQSLSLVLESFSCTFFQRSKVTLRFTPGRIVAIVAIIAAGETRERFLTNVNSADTLGYILIARYGTIRFCILI